MNTIKRLKYIGIGITVCGLLVSLSAQYVKAWERKIAYNPHPNCMSQRVDNNSTVTLTHCE